MASAISHAVAALGIGAAFAKPVSPIMPARFFSARGLSVLAGEFLWIWILTALVAPILFVSRRFSREPGAPG